MLTNHNKLACIPSRHKLRSTAISQRRITRRGWKQRVIGRLGVSAIDFTRRPKISVTEFYALVDSNGTRGSLQGLAELVAGWILNSIPSGKGSSRIVSSSTGETQAIVTHVLLSLSPVKIPFSDMSFIWKLPLSHIEKIELAVKGLARYELKGSNDAAVR